jgi:hypothetical protein
VVLLNSLELALDDPTQPNNTELQKILEFIFLGVYVLEMLLKIIGFGVYYYRHSYFRDPWNVLDFFVIVVTIISMFGIGITDDSAGKPVYFSSVKIFSPLRTIKSIPKLKNLINTILNSIPSLFEMVFVVFFIFGVFSIIGLHLFAGQLHNKCIPMDTGRASTVFEEEKLCGGTNQCEPGFMCAKIAMNPFSGTFSFDNILDSYLMVYIVATLEGWSLSEQFMIKAFSWTSVIYYTFLVFIGAYLMLNLFLAIVVEKFNEVKEETEKKRSITVRNATVDRIIHKIFPQVEFSEEKTGINYGVPMPKMLLLNPEKYKHISK